MNARLLSALIVAAPLFIQAETQGWHQWRGPQRDGVSPETGLLKEWPKEGPKLLWQAKGLGAGMGSVSIANGKVFVQGKRKEGQAVVALDAATQKELWATVVSEKGDQPNGAPTVADGLVFAVSKDGKLLCCDETSGKELWRKDFAADFGGQMMSGWGFSESPLVDGDAVIVTCMTLSALPTKLVVIRSTSTVNRYWYQSASSDCVSTSMPSGAVRSSSPVGERKACITCASVTVPTTTASVIGF